MIAEAVGLLLEVSGYRVTLTGNGLEALEADQRDPADILVTDLRMPRLDGVALVSRIRERHPSLPIVMMTGFSETVPPHEAGRLMLLRKPIHGDQIARAVQAMLALA